MDNLQIEKLTYSPLVHIFSNTFSARFWLQISLESIPVIQFLLTASKFLFDKLYFIILMYVNF